MGPGTGPGQGSSTPVSISSSGLVPSNGQHTPLNIIQPQRDVALRKIFLPSCFQVQILCISIFVFFFLIISLCNTFTSLFLQILRKSRTSRKQLERQVRRVLLLQWTGDYQCTLSYIADPIFLLIIFNLIYFSNGCVEYSLDQQNQMEMRLVSGMFFNK